MKGKNFKLTILMATMVTFISTAIVIPSGASGTGSGIGMDNKGNMTEFVVPDSNGHSNHQQEQVSEPSEKNKSIPVQISKYVKKLEILSNGYETFWNIYISKSKDAEIDTVLNVSNNTKVYKNNAPASLGDIHEGMLISYERPEIITMQFPAMFATSYIRIEDSSDKNNLPPIPMSTKYIVKKDLSKGVLYVSEKRRGAIETVLQVNQDTKVVKNGKQVKLVSLKKNQKIQFKTPNVTTTQVPHQFGVQEIFIR